MGYWENTSCLEHGGARGALSKARPFPLLQLRVGLISAFRAFAQP